MKHKGKIRFLSLVLIAVITSTAVNNCIKNDNVFADASSETQYHENWVREKGPEEKVTYGPGITKELVVGADDRKTIDDTAKSPYSAVAHIYMSYKCGHAGNGTGFMISDNTMATAGHCVICPYCKQPLSSIICKFGYDCKSGTSIVMTDGCEEFFHDDDYLNTTNTDIHDLECDYAFVKFSHNIGKITGHFGIKAFSDKDLVKQEFNFAGYRLDGDPLKIAKSKVATGIYYLNYNGKKVNIDNNNLINFTADVVQGNSGGPIYNKDNCVTGIIIAEFSSYNFNVGRRVTGETMKFLKSEKLISGNDASKAVKNMKYMRLSDDKMKYSIDLDNKSSLCLCIPGELIGNVKWTSSDESIVKVKNMGIISAEKLGKAKLTADYYGKTITVNVNVVYKDVKDPEKFWYTPTYYLSDKNVVKGYADQTEFRPANECTRAQMVTFLWRLEGCPKPKSSKCAFTDVKEGDYFYKAVIWANEQGITEGYDDGSFGPEKACQRKHAVTFLWRLAGKPDPKTTKNKFSDVKSTDYFYKAVLWTSEKKIVAGYDNGTFQPNGKCLRRQMVTFLYKYDVNIKSKK